MGNSISKGGKVLSSTKYQVKQIIKTISGENEEESKVLDKAADNPLTKSERTRRHRNRKRDFKARREVQEDVVSFRKMERKCLTIENSIVS
jgi:hypothetical protein